MIKKSWWNKAPRVKDLQRSAALQGAGTGNVCGENIPGKNK